VSDLRTALEWWGGLDRELAKWAHVGEILRAALEAEQAQAAAQKRLAELNAQIVEAAAVRQRHQELEGVRQREQAEQRAAEQRARQQAQAEHEAALAGLRAALETATAELAARRHDLEGLEVQIRDAGQKLDGLQRQWRETVEAALKAP